MALQYLLSSAFIDGDSGPKRYNPGDLVDDTSQGYALLAAAGYQFWPATDPVFAQAALLASNARLRGADEATVQGLLLNAIVASLRVGTQPDANGFADAVTLRVALPAGGAPGAGDAPVLLAKAPYKFRIIEATMQVTTGVAASTVLVYSNSTGTGGTAYTDAMSSATAGQVRSNKTTTSGVVPVGGAVYAVRSDRSMVGDIVLTCQREP